jgi:hypothetical protein
LIEGLKEQNQQLDYIEQEINKMKQE